MFNGRSLLLKHSLYNDILRSLKYKIQKIFPLIQISNIIIIDHSGMYNCQYEIFFPPLRIAEICRSLYAHLPQMHKLIWQNILRCRIPYRWKSRFVGSFIKIPSQIPSKDTQLQLSKLVGFEIDILSLLAQNRDSICLEDFLNIQSLEIKKAFIDLQKKGLIRHTYAGRWCLYRESPEKKSVNCSIYHCHL